MTSASAARANVKAPSKVARVVLPYFGAFAATLVIGYFCYPNSRYYYERQFRDLTSAGKMPGLTIVAHRNIEFNFGFFPIDYWRIQHSSEAFEALLKHSYFSKKDGSSTELRRETEDLFHLPPMTLEGYEFYVSDHQCLIETVLVSKDHKESFYAAFPYI